MVNTATILWHEAEREILSKYKEEYDETRAAFRANYPHEIAKNKARAVTVRNHYAEFQKILLHKKALNFKPDKPFLKFKDSVIRWRSSGVSNSLIDTEIERMVRRRAQSALSKLHKEEYDTLRKEYVRAGAHPNTARVSSYNILSTKYNVEYIEVLKETRDKVHEMLRTDYARVG